MTYLGVLFFNCVPTGVKLQVAGVGVCRSGLAAIKSWKYIRKVLLNIDMK